MVNIIACKDNLYGVYVYIGKMYSKRLAGYWFKISLISKVIQLAKRIVLVECTFFYKYSANTNLHIRPYEVY